MTNEERAEYGRKAVRFGQPDTDEKDEPHTAVVDTLANIMHYCAEAGVVWTDALEAADMHYEAEFAGIDDEGPDRP